MTEQEYTGSRGWHNPFGLKYEAGIMTISEKTKEQLAREIEEARRKNRQMRTAVEQNRRELNVLRHEANSAKALLDVAGVIMAVVDSDEIITMVNRKTCEVLGYTEDELVGENWFDFLVPSEERQQRRQVFHQILAGEMEMSIRENVLLAKDGREILGSFFNTTLAEPDGTVTGRLMSGEDITERRKAEKALKEEQRLNSLLLSSLPYPAMVINRQSIIISANRKAREIGAKIGRRCWNIFGEPDVAAGESPVDKVDGSAVSENSCSFCRMDQVFNSYSVVKDESVSAIGRFWDVYWVPLDTEHVLHYAIDITEHKQMEEQLLHSQVLASLGEMTAGIAHEVGNPLASIMLYSEVALKSGAVSDQMFEDLKVIYNEAKRAGDLMKDLLIYSRKMKPQARKVNICGLIDEVIRLRQYQETVRNISVERRFATDIIPVKGDHTQLTQVLLNLMLNAEEALKEQGDGVINIDCCEEDGFARITVADNGPGIPDQYLDQIFHPFFSTKKIGEGTGLGLSTCYGIVTAHDGLISAANGQDGGAIFTMKLPLMRQED